MLDVNVIGHRGAALLAPENTLAAIRAAASTGVKWVEIDVYLIADGSLIIFHDNELDRCTNGTGFTAQATLPYIQSLDAGNSFDDAFKGEPVPTLVDALLCIQDLGLGLNLEIKFDEGDVSKIVPGVLSALETHWKDNEKLLISSFNKDVLKVCYELNSERHFAQLYDDIPDNWQSELEQIQAYSLHCHFEKLAREKAIAVKEAGYKLLCYTANEPAQVEQHWEWGMDAIITDDPTVFLSQKRGFG
ncbi:glycerophosphoryl diester phosphodiesterase [Marinomonas sp. 2405UD68-3]|uniref:glycerophosphoryl diester phosphodiesterase n=1 Tax=Marinomonas sp. 2405UD68-3 TaxID=3391835 RepID=UPI0039C9E750